MAYDLQKIRNKALTFVKRPLDDTSWIEITNDIINEAVRVLQQKIPDCNALETIDNTVIYPANTESINLLDINLKDVNKIISVQRLFKSGDYTGKPLVVLDYTSLTQKMLYFEKKEIPVSFENEEFNSFKSYISDVEGSIAYLLGTKLGLYPTPSQDILLAVHYTKYLPDLINETDTNVLLQNCSEYIFYYCLRQLNVLLSEADRISISSSLLQDSLDSAISWNASLVHSNPINL